MHMLILMRINMGRSMGRSLASASDFKIVAFKPHGWLATPEDQGSCQAAAHAAAHVDAHEDEHMHMEHMGHMDEHPHAGQLYIDDHPHGGDEHVEGHMDHHHPPAEDEHVDEHPHAGEDHVDHHLPHAGDEHVDEHPHAGEHHVDEHPHVEDGHMEGHMDHHLPHGEDEHVDEHPHAGEHHVDEHPHAGGEITGQHPFDPPAGEEHVAEEEKHFSAAEDEDMMTAREKLLNEHPHLNRHVLGHVVTHDAPEEKTTEDQPPHEGAGYYGLSLS